VVEGRRKFLSQFPSLASPEAQARLSDPSAPETFQDCKLDPDERAANGATEALHRDLLRLRRSEAAFRARRADQLQGAVLSPEALALRFFTDDAEPTGDRLLLVNLGRDLPLSPIPEPLLAPPDGARWRLVWCSEAVAYGGGGTPAAVASFDQGWTLPGGAAAVFAPVVQAQAAAADPGRRPARGPS